jgi:transposase InsO family protein
MVEKNCRGRLSSSGRTSGRGRSESTSGPRSSVHGDGLHEPIGKERRGQLDGWQAEKSLGKNFDFYRDERPHQALGYRTPSKVYTEG